MSTFWGYHLMLDCSDCDLDAMTSHINVVNFAKELVKKIDMIPFGAPMVVNFGTGDKAGFTLIQLIETSNICAHFSNETQAIYLDVFSCKSFNIDDVINTVGIYFKPNKMRHTFLIRQA
jgi:S-adenosylmethionine/arginine decarboxylase-like enzyme